MTLYYNSVMFARNNHCQRADDCAYCKYKTRFVFVHNFVEKILNESKERSLKIK